MMFNARRRLCAFTAAGIAAAVAGPSVRAEAAARPKTRAVALDAFTTFGPRPVAALADRLFGSDAAALMDAWRLRQFEYTWLRTAMGRYADFLRVTEDALVFAARPTKVDLGPTPAAACSIDGCTTAAWTACSTRI
jgi:2-haloacid dehalogenase